MALRLYIFGIEYIRKANKVCYSTNMQADIFLYKLNKFCEFNSNLHFSINLEFNNGKLIPGITYHFKWNIHILNMKYNHLTNTHTRGRGNAIIKGFCMQLHAALSNHKLAFWKVWYKKLLTKKKIGGKSIVNIREPTS